MTGNSWIASVVRTAQGIPVTHAKDVAMRYCLPSHRMFAAVRVSLLAFGVLRAATVRAQNAARVRPSPQAIASAVDSMAQRVMAAELTPALGVAVVMDGRTILTKAYGMTDVSNRIPASERTLWYLASTSKSFTGFGAALLAHEGTLAFDTPIATLLPKARWHERVNASTLTLAQFLSHTHHLDGNVIETTAAFTGAIAEPEWPALMRFVTPTGNSDLVYSNLGYNVAAMVIDAKQSAGWKAYLERAVYRPAGMRETYARVSGLDARRFARPHTLSSAGVFSTGIFFKTDETMNAAGGHLATLGDLARWVTVQMDSGMLDGRRVFPAAAVALSHRMIAPHTVTASKRFAYFDREGWGAGWDIGTYSGERMVSRFGSYSTTRSHVSMLPGRRIGVVAQVNGRPGWNATDLLAAYAYDLEAGRENARALAEQRLATLVTQRRDGLRQIAVSDSTRASRQKPMDRALTDFEGAYRHEAYGTITFALRSDTLHYKLGAMYGPAEVFDAATRQLRIELAGGQTVRFVFSGPGRASALELFGVTFQRRP